MNNFRIIGIHVLIWSWFTIVIFLSKKDARVAEVGIFLLFLYIAYLLTNRYIYPKKKALFITIRYMIVFFCVQQICRAIIHVM